jgi:hypothetical protein
MPKKKKLSTTAEPSCIYPTIAASLLSLTFEDTYISVSSYLCVCVCVCVCVCACASAHSECNSYQGKQVDTCQAQKDSYMSRVMCLSTNEQSNTACVRVLFWGSPLILQ